MARSDEGDSGTKLTAQSFRRVPVWCWDDANERLVPVEDFDPLPVDRGTLFIKASLTAASGLQLDGYIIGLDVPYAFALLTEDEEFLFNMNIPESAPGTLQNFCVAKGVEEFELFPVRYTTELGFPDTPPLSGVLSW